MPCSQVLPFLTSKVYTDPAYFGTKFMRRVLGQLCSPYSLRALQKFLTTSLEMATRLRQTEVAPRNINRKMRGPCAIDDLGVFSST
jgi:hypothetical protein